MASLVKNLGKNLIKMPKVHIKVVIWQSIEVDEGQANGIMDGTLSPYDLDGNVEHLFETEHQLTPEENSEVMSALNDTGGKQTLEVWDDEGNILWANAEGKPDGHGGVENPFVRLTISNWRANKKFQASTGLSPTHQFDGFFDYDDIDLHNDMATVVRALGRMDSSHYYFTTEGEGYDYRRKIPAEPRYPLGCEPENGYGESKDNGLTGLWMVFDKGQQSGMDVNSIHPKRYSRPRVERIDEPTGQEPLESDEVAWELARLAGYDLDMDGYVCEFPYKNEPRFKNPTVLIQSSGRSVRTEPKYRPFKEGDVIEEGDQVGHRGEWFPFNEGVYGEVINPQFVEDGTARKLIK